MLPAAGLKAAAAAMSAQLVRLLLDLLYKALLLLPSMWPATFGCNADG
jgi:hypothetical protein